MDNTYAKIVTILTQALNIEEEIITPNSSIQSMLGAESIDMLDIVFRIEREFNIKITKQELFPDEKISAIIANHTNNNCLTPTGVEELKRTLPHSDLADFATNPTVSSIPDLFTVQTLTNYVNHKTCI